MQDANIWRRPIRMPAAMQGVVARVAIGIAVAGMIVTVLASELWFFGLPAFLLFLLGIGYLDRLIGWRRTVWALCASLLIGLAGAYGWMVRDEQALGAGIGVYSALVMVRVRFYRGGRVPRHLIIIVWSMIAGLMVIGAIAAVHQVVQLRAR